MGASGTAARALFCRAFLCTAAIVALAAQAQPRGDATVSRLIVKFRDTGVVEAQAETTARLARFAADAASAGVGLTHARSMALGAHVMALDRRLPARGCGGARRAARAESGGRIRPARLSPAGAPHPERCALQGAVVSDEFTGRYPRGRRLGRDDRLDGRGDRGRRHRVPAALGPRGPDSAQLRLHLGPEGRERRQRARRRRDRSGRLDRRERSQGSGLR